MDTQIISNMVTLHGSVHDFSERIVRAREPITQTLLAWDEDETNSDMTGVNVVEESSIGDSVSVGRLTIDFHSLRTRRRLAAPGVEREPVQHFEENGQITAKYTYVSGDIFITQVAKNPASRNGDGIVRWLKELDEA